MTNRTPVGSVNMRSKFLRLLPLGIAFSLAVALTGLTAKAATPPNIIFIMADDLGWGHLGCYGQSKIRTPHLDQMRREGMKFTQFYSGANVCAPARSTLMTGLHTGHTPIRSNGRQASLEADDVTVAELLKQAGYTTGGFGKWGLGDVATPGVAPRKGFYTWFGHYVQTHAHFYYPYFLMHNLERYPLPENEGRQRQRYAHDEIHAQALNFIRENAKGPFFAYLAYILPHVELAVPEDSRREYAGAFPKVALPDPRPGYISSDDAYVDYAAMVSRLDRHVGELFALLKELNIDDNTIVFFTSDNGPQGSTWKSLTVEFFQGAGPFRGNKGMFYEGGIREPLLVRWPGRIEPNSTTEQVGYFPDILPTLAELAGVAAPQQIDGVSLVPTLLGQPDKQVQHGYLYWEMPRGKAPDTTICVAIRQGDWKAIDPFGRGRWELYNLQQDLGETTDLAELHPEILSHLKTLAAGARTPERPFSPGPKRSASDYVR